MPRGNHKPGKPNKSQAIRDAFKANPKATAKDIVALLAQKQIAVKPGLIYMIKGRMAQKKAHRKRRAVRAARASQKTGSADPVALIIKVKELAKEAGGMGNLKTLISVLAE